MSSQAAYPSLSVVVNNYNYAQFLGEALDSALAQLAATDELVVVDDGSSDNSMQILEHYAAHHHIRFIRQANQGQMKAVRTGIDNARGDVIVLLDSDDCFLPGYLQRLREVYRDNPEVSFVFCRPEVGGPPSSSLETTRANLRRMELPHGLIGRTRWAALLFHEYVGAPTSGNSLSRSLGQQIVTLPDTLNGTWRLSPRLAHLLGVSETEANRAGLSADGVILRVASILGAVKYCDSRPGFLYRIHGSNKYASGSRFGHIYLRRLRRRMFNAIVREHFDLHAQPTAEELREEITNRHFGLRFRRRLHIRARYFLAALASSGTPRGKAGAVAAAIGYSRRQIPRREAPNAEPKTLREDAQGRRTATRESGKAARD